MLSARVFATGAALAGVALTLQACSATSETPSASAPSQVADEAATTTASPVSSENNEAVADANYDEIMAGERKVLIHVAEDDKDWSATYEGPIGMGDGTTDGALFRIVPAADGKYLLEALRSREEGGRWCIYGDKRQKPVSLGTKKCVEDETTLFKVTKTGERDDKGRATHNIVNAEFGAVQVKNDGSNLYVQQVGDGGTRGTYSFVDRGAIE